MKSSLARHILALVLSSENADAVLGDLEEERTLHGRTSLWFWRQVVSVSFAHARERFAERRPSGKRRRRHLAVETVASWLSDLRLGARGLRSSPSFTAISAATLALGIGGVTALFCIVDGVLLSPLSFPQPDRIVRVWNSYAVDPLDEIPLSVNEVYEYGVRSRSFEAFSGFDFSRMNLTGADEPRRLLVARVQSAFFDVFAVPPALGRGFTEDEDHPGADDVLVLSHRLWQGAFGARDDVVGRRLELDGRSRTVVGVAAPELDYPSGVDAFVPMAIDPAELDAETMLSHGKAAIARLADSVTLERAEDDLARVIRGLEEIYPGHFAEGDRATLILLKETQVGAVRPTLIALLGAVGFVLLIACANVASLLLVRGELRRGEIAVKAALGASRHRIARERFLEGLLLAGSGGVLGVAFAKISLAALLTRVPGSLPRLETIALDARVLLFSLLVTVSTALLFGLLPALDAGRTSVDGLRERLRLSRASHRLRRAFVTGQIALALVLLSGAGLMLRSFQHLLAVKPGISAEGWLAFDLALPGDEYDDAARVAFEYDRLVERVQAVPGVSRVGAVSWLPFASYPSNWTVEIEGREVATDEDHPLLDYALVTGDYFGAVGIPVFAGRSLTAEDRGAVSGVVISKKAAEILFPGEEPLGRRVRLYSDPVWRTIVGVVGDHQNRGLERESKPGIYLPHVELRTGKPFIARDMTFVVETAGAPGALAGVVREAVKEVAPDLPISGVRTVEEILAESVSGRRFSLEILSLFGIIGLTLGAIGIYGVVSNLVTERRREIALRVALGATGSDVRRLVVGNGLRLVLAGVVLGIALAYMATRALMARLLFEVAPGDPATMAAVTTVLAATGLVAILVPTRRALLVDPAVTLREE
ncbi:MAG TPA: ABC transporter permease [Vicinamibacteria bacterium]|nr:ABC transporter permease [Vicinamibacteria bacterium]